MTHSISHESGSGKQNIETSNGDENIGNDFGLFMAFRGLGLAFNTTERPPLEKICKIVDKDMLTMHFPTESCLRLSRLFKSGPLSNGGRLDAFIKTTKKI